VAITEGIPTLGMLRVRGHPRGKTGSSPELPRSDYGGAGQADIIQDISAGDRVIVSRAALTYGPYTSSKLGLGGPVSGLAGTR
jgi:hypothetical protein